MIKILFICHGNICRSAAAEVVLRQMISEKLIEKEITVSSAATTREEIGNDIYPSMKKALLHKNYTLCTHAARQTTRTDYSSWDFIIGMDEENLWDLSRIYGGDPEGKLSLLMDWAGQKGREIEDPWYTRNFDRVLGQIEEGCEGIIRFLQNRRNGAK